MKIVCVCGFGLGSSVMAKMNVEAILKEKNIDASVEAVDVGSVRGVAADYFITTREISGNMPNELNDRTIVVTNFINKKEMEEGISKIFEEK